MLFLVASLICLGAIDCQIIDQILNQTCTTDIDCLPVHFAAKCFNSSSPSNCYCASNQGFYRRGDTCVYHSKVLETCDAAGESSVCEDSNSECVAEAQGVTGIRRCLCKSGTLLVRYNNTDRCAYPITVREDSSCEECDANRGTCFALQQDQSRDGCACAPSFSGDNCEKVHVNVTCTTTDMRVCYEPHPFVNLTRGLFMHSDGKSYQYFCRGRYDPVACGPNGYSLNISLREAFLSVCGTQVQWEYNKIKYTNTIRVQLDPQQASYNDILFTTFCSFYRRHDLPFFGMNVDSYTGTEVGQDIKPVISLGIRNNLRQYLREGVFYRPGDIVYLNIFLDTNNGYSAMRIEDCTLSSSAVIPDANAETVPIVAKGCPSPGQFIITEANMFQKVRNQSNEMETGMVQLVQLRQSDTIHIHCRVKLCVKNYFEGCVPHTCEARRRRAIERPEDINFITLHGSVSFASTSQQTVILGMSISSIVFSVVVLILIIIFIAYIAVQTRYIVHRYRRQSKQKKVLLSARQLFIKRYSRQGLPSHMTESRI